MSTQITNKQVKIVSNVDFNEKEIENAVIDASKNTMSGIITELTAGNGININGNTISLKGTTQLPDQTDIDTIITEGNYFIDSPTSTYGLPDLPTTVPAGTVTSWVCLLLVEKQYGYGTYFIRQTITFTPIVGSYVTYLSSDTLMFTRILSDYTSQGYPTAQTAWTKIDGDMTLITNYSYNTVKTVSNLKPGYNYLLNGTTTSLTLENIANSSDEIRVTFYTGNNFTLTQNQLTFLNFDNIQFEASKYYIITIKNLYATVDCVGENINYKVLIDQVIGKSDLQKRLVAGNNITITDYGWQGFSTTNNLELNTEHSDYVNLIKFNLNELNKNSIFFYTQYYDEHLSEMLEGYLEINNENKLHLYYEYSIYSGYYGRYVKSVWDYTGSTILQANKYYWITQKSQGFQPTLNYTYLIEDNNYTVDSLPAISEWTQQFSTGTTSYILHSSQDYPAYIGYDPTNNNYFAGVIQEFKTTNFNLSTAVVGTDFINNGCVNGTIISAIVPVDSELSNISENAVQNKVIDAALRAMKPVIVTDSGATLPSASGYQLNDTFLNTTDKKIYKAEMTIESYELNTDVTNEGITVDLQTGIASGFVPTGGGVYTPKGIRHNNLNILWKEPITLNFHFNITETRDNQVIATLYQGGYEYKCVSFYIANDNKIYLTYTQGSGGSSTQSNIFLLADYQLLLNTEYFVEINKNGTNVTTTISTQGYNISPEYEETINNVEDWYPSDNYSYLIYGYYNSGPLSGGQSVFSGSIYLADSFGEFLLPVETISWDSGTSILNSTGYIDKANGILHYYESPDLISIGGGSGALAKKVYKFNSDNTSTLDVSSDFTKIVDVLKNGVELVLTDDYTISNGVITFVTALSTTDKITVKGE